MAGDSFTIGKVVKALLPEYPSLSISKVRFLENEGLIKPKRTKSGYRLYSEADIERLRTILRLQETCFYPLSVIKEKLDAGDDISHLNQDASSNTAISSLRELPNGPVVVEDSQVLLGVPSRFVRTLADQGLLKLSRNDQRRDTFDGSDASMITAAYELKRYGIDPRFLKPYLQRANRDVPLFKQALLNQLGRSDDLSAPAIKKRFDAILDNLISLTSSIEEHLVRRGVEEEFSSR